MSYPPQRRRWRPPVHCCLLDRSCWSDRREFGMPMRLYLFWPTTRWVTLLGERDLGWERVDIKIGDDVKVRRAGPGDGGR